MPALRAVLLLILAATPLSASSADDFYLAFVPGAVLLQDADVSSAGLTSGRGELEFDPGYLIGAAAGLVLGDFRLELDLGFREQDVDRLHAGGGSLRTTGELGVFSALLNACYDLDLGRFKPYLGGGVGVARLDLDTGFSGETAEIDDDSVGFAWNLAAGVYARVYGSIELGVGYRYLDLGDPSFGSNLGTDFEVELQAHEALLGVRRRF